VRAAAKQRVEKLLEDAQIKLCAKRSQQASADIAEREAKIEAEIAPLARVVDRLDEICGVGQTAAQLIIAEIGVDMGRFPPSPSGLLAPDHRLALLADPPARFHDLALAARPPRQR
jgi:hypothetical protein